MSRTRRSLLVLPLLALLLSLPPLWAGEEAQPTPYEVKLADPDDPADPYYRLTPAWDEATRGPLPRWRLGPDGQNATPPPVYSEDLQPRRIDLPQFDLAPDGCQIDSPPEYSPTDGVLYRYSSGAWPDVVTDLVASLTGDPTKDEIAYVVVADTAQQNAATSDFTAAGADMSKVSFILMPTDSIWMRDYGPHYIWQGGADAIVDSLYYPNRPLDNFIPTLLGDDYFVEPSYDIPLYYSGGNFMPTHDRQGFVTSLIRDDNPDLSDQVIADLYGKYQGIDTMHVFDRLPPSVDGTGHIDMWMYLVDEDDVIIGEFIPGSDPTAINITNNAVPYMEGLGYTVHRVPAWNANHPGQGNTHYTYTNAFRVNDRIFIPTYGQGDPAYLQRDNDAIAAWETAAGPSVDIVPINAYDIIWAAGAIHCIVMQVPRYDASLPSACTAEPDGGELLEPDTTHEIRWTADDDGTVTSIDLAYSTDGGLTYPPSQVIATGLVDDGSYMWTVPQVETSQARIRVTAYDDSSNSVVVESENDVIIESALRTVYDFSSGAGVDKWMYGSSTSDWSVLDGVRRPAAVGTEISATNYSRIGTSDATGGDADTNRYISPGPGFFNESTHIIEVDIAEDPAQIIDIEVLWEGYADNANQVELYVWDYVTGQWCDGAGNCGANNFMDNYSGNRDDVLEGHIRSDFNRFLDGSGLMTVLVYGEAYDFFGNQSFHDYFSVTVTHDPCAGGDLDFDGFADLCDNCVATVNVDQTNGDTDSAGDACDCAPADGTAFAVPFEIQNATILADTTTLTWDSDAANSGSGTTYDVMRGDLGELPVGSGAQETCAGDNIAGTSLGGLATPAAGTGHFYLVRGANVCGAGSYGFDSTPQERTSAACP